MDNVYNLYVQNGNQAGFYVRRNSWGNTLFFVASIGGKISGALSGKPPYYGNPTIKGYYCNASKTRLPDSEVFGSSKEELSCPGCYQWAIVE